MPNKHAQSLSLTVRNLYVQYRLLFLVLGLLIMMDVSQYCVYIKSMYHACLLKRLTDRRRAADAVHSFLHKNVCDLLMIYILPSGSSFLTGIPEQPGFFAVIVSL